MTHKAAMPVLLQEVLSEAVTKRQLVLSAVRRDRDAAKILNDARMKQAEIRCHSVDAKPFWEVSRVIHHPQIAPVEKMAHASLKPKHQLRNSSSTPVTKTSQSYQSMPGAIVDVPRSEPTASKATSFD